MPILTKSYLWKFPRLVSVRKLTYYYYFYFSVERQRWIETTCLDIVEFPHGEVKMFSFSGKLKKMGCIYNNCTHNQQRQCWTDSMGWNPSALMKSVLLKVCPQQTLAPSWMKWSTKLRTYLDSLFIWGFDNWRIWHNWLIFCLVLFVIVVLRLFFGFSLRDKIWINVCILFFFCFPRDIFIMVSCQETQLSRGLKSITSLPERNIDRFWDLCSFTRLYFCSLKEATNF